VIAGAAVPFAFLLLDDSRELHRLCRMEDDRSLPTASPGPFGLPGRVSLARPEGSVLLPGCGMGTEFPFSFDGLGGWWCMAVLSWWTQLSR
jgi:hypothetical protein